MTALDHAAPAIAMLAAFLLVGVGVRTAMRSDTRIKGVLMLVMAAVLIANVAIWTL